MKDESAPAQSGSGVPPLFSQSEEAGRLFHFKRGENLRLPTTKVSSKVLGMSATDILAKARELRPEERREIAEALLDDLDSKESPEFIAELERRVEDAQKNPDDWIPWEQIRAESKKKYNWP